MVRVTIDEAVPRRGWLVITFKVAQPTAIRCGPVAVLVAGLVSSGVMLVGYARQLWFFGDDWDLLLYRGTVAGTNQGFFFPHNEHWVTIPILIYRAIFAVVGLRHYLPYALPVIAAHLGVVALMYLVLVRFGTSRWVAVIVSMFLAFLGAGAANTLWDFQIGFVGAVFFGLLALRLYDRHEQFGWRIWVVWVPLLLALMCSGVALAMLGTVCVYAVLRHGFVRGAVLSSAPVAAYAAWYVGWGRLISPPAVSNPLDYLRVPQYVWIGLTSTWQRSFGIPDSGAVILVVLVAAALLARSAPTKLRNLAWAGLAGALMQLVLSGLSRISFGVEQARAPRYVYLVAVLMAPALALLLQLVAERLTAPRWLPACLVVTLTALVVINGVRLTDEYMVGRRTLVASMRERLLSTVALLTQGSLVLTTKPDRRQNLIPNTEMLSRPEVQAVFPAQSVGAQGLLDGAAQIEVGVSGARLPIPSAKIAALRGFVGTKAAASGCHDYSATAPRPVIEVPPTTTGSQIRITSATTTVTTRLRRGSLVSGPVKWPVQPGLPIFVGTSAPNASLRITINHAGLVTICTQS